MNILMVQEQIGHYQPLPPTSYIILNNSNNNKEAGSLSMCRAVLDLISLGRSQMETDTSGGNTMIQDSMLNKYLQ